MPRSKTRSFKIPYPLADALQLQMEKGVIAYDSLNAAVIGLIAYQVIVGMGHPITSELMKLSQPDQDCIHDFLLEMTKRKMTLKGQLLNAMIHRAMGTAPAVKLETISRLQCTSLLELAQRWRDGDETVWDDIDQRKWQAQVAE